MELKITLENLFSFAYNETEILETINVVDAIENDEEIAEEYQVILATKELLDNASFEPSKKALDKIFKYSKLKNSALTIN
ncbi:MAG: hypothetical protein WCL14_06950 [Bacteroidota bacterium]